MSLKPETEHPSKENPGTFWYVDGCYFKLTEKVDPEWFDALAKLMHKLVETGYAQPPNDYGIVSCDKNGKFSETPMFS